MAAEPSMHPRALRRKLEAEQMTYGDVVAELRMKLAIEYLRNTRVNPLGHATQQVCRYRR